MTSSYRYCRVQPTCAAQYVSNKLAGAPIYSLSGGRSIVPLLHPQDHGLPFALTLELHSRQPAAGLPPPPPAAVVDRSVYTLHYVLGGSGELVREGGIEKLQAGDAVLMHSGAALCRGAAVADPQDGGPQAEGAASLLGTDWQLAELVAYMPRELFEQQAAADQQRAQALQHVSSLQPLLPSSSGVVGCLPQQVTQQLLAGAKETARKALLGDASRQQEQQQDLHQHQLQSSTSTSSQGGTRGGSSQLPPLLRSAASSLAEWWQQQQERTCPVTKRTLAELTAFQLPNQTNRLAVQFDPFSRPQVPFISGLEIFERGHRTTPHIHPTAHELFFILAGHGTGFCGHPGPSQERFPVSAGDVVVFRPGAVHGIDNGDATRMYCLELMVPNEEFAEFVRTGTDTGHLADDDLCVLASIGCR